MLAIRLSRQSQPLLTLGNPLLCISARNMASVRDHVSPLASPPPSKRVKLDLIEEPVGDIAEERANADEASKGRTPVTFESKCLTALTIVDPRKQTGKNKSKKTRAKRQNIEPYSSDDVLWHDVKAALSSEAVEAAIKEDKDWESPLQFGDELELTVSELTSTGQFGTFWVYCPTDVVVTFV